jgi:hypothetical protein
VRGFSGRWRIVRFDFLAMFGSMILVATACGFPLRVSHFPSEINEPERPGASTKGLKAC